MNFPTAVILYKNPPVKCIVTRTYRVESFTSCCGYNCKVHAYAAIA